jgi:UTP--glucose-1-phosphate uridylyltransferase
MLGDEIYPQEPCLQPLIEAHERYHSSVLTLVTVPYEQISSYGIASAKAQEDNIFQVTDLVEKPKPAEAPSDLAVAGRYVITPDIFALIEKLPPGRGGEIQLTDALQIQARQGSCHGIPFAGLRYDMGTPIGLLTTSIAMGLRRPDMAPPLREYMRQVLETE